MKNEPKEPATPRTETTLSPSEHEDVPSFAPVGGEAATTVAANQLTTAPSRPSHGPRSERLRVQTQIRAGGRGIVIDRPYRP